MAPYLLQRVLKYGRKDIHRVYKVFFKGFECFEGLGVYGLGCRGLGFSVCRGFRVLGVGVLGSYGFGVSG